MIPGRSTSRPKGLGLLAARPPAPRPGQGGKGGDTPSQEPRPFPERPDTPGLQPNPGNILALRPLPPSRASTPATVTRGYGGNVPPGTQTTPHLVDLVPLAVEAIG